jgi:hypothetical protein
MKEVKTKFYRHKSGGLMIYLPTKITQDSAFPFKKNSIKVRIVGRKIVLEEG